LMSSIGLCETLLTGKPIVQPVEVCVLSSAKPEADMNPLCEMRGIKTTTIESDRNEYL